MSTSGSKTAHRSKWKQAVADAERYAKKNLRTLVRRTGENYATHGMEVSKVLLECVSDASLLRVAVLHDILVHPQGEQLLKDSPLSQSESALVLEMHSLRRLHIDSKTRDLDTVIDAFLANEKLLPLRMAHRLNDVRHIDRFSGTLKKQIAHETLHMYAAIAGRLGMHAWRHEMEDICFRVSYPKIASNIQAQFDAMRKLDLLCLRQTRRFLQKVMKTQGIACVIDERIKTLYSTYRKMVLKRRPFQELTDRLAIRIVVKDAMDCYKVLALVHAHMHPIPGKLKDYIGSPKENGYQSIHTVVYPLPGITEQPIEIQIRTDEMHSRCEFGAASHGEYKNFLYALQAKPARVELFRNLENLREDARSPSQFEEALRKYFNEDHAAIFDNRNNLYHLKKPATVLDFVVHAYPKRFMRLKEVFINGRKRKLDTVLHDGDIVRPVFGKGAYVTSQWVGQCAHGRTKQLIRSVV